ncbi:hypothetical protein FC62_GL001423 [Amylolactobacillus amylotrophicus DSM 20534]|uniref:Uncharacterized protein n=3 Tax=Amylolactobacillus TaxID=2767876 RepID=A0A0R1YHM2_9LACO|nr:MULTISPECIES: phosphatase PAP2 family protein [Amylolactobacillus]APT18018.1 hypothetical protein LA20533_01200 [Amylolactobacillus amylophilus DSM 20533 = JCM 1125]KRK37307.1 hypothetical protein FC62_GL001423 [Amylolactobacillus amylotrophicus DSM 20534]KRM41706.1 hypothetical protein FD40_GL001269 [Amylolactobacillus amylophilus DSM 20533 = JCM 1125]GED80696.1 phosphatase PAP2 family protein [Amylolactobacillus amylophilus]
MNQNQIRARKFGIASLVLLLLFLTWAILVATSQPVINSFDKTLINVIVNHNETNLIFARSITVVGNTKTMTVLTIIAAALLLLIKRYPLALYFAGTMALANLTNSIVKHIIKRPRPTAHHLVHAGGYSFPSGHSIGSITFFSLLIIVTIILVKSHVLQTLATLIFGSMPILIGYSRIYLHVHFPSDVLGGFLLGLTFIMVSLYLYYRYRLSFNPTSTPFARDSLN